MQSDEGERAHINISKHQLQTLPSIQNQLQLCRGNNSVENEKGIVEGDELDVWINWSQEEIIGRTKPHIVFFNSI